MSGIADILGSQRSIGRYFAIVSTIPSALLTIFLYVLVKSSAPTGAPHWSQGVSALMSIGIGGAAVLAVASLAVSLVLHPMQFSLTQLFEGYWGVSEPMQKLRELRIRHYRARFDTLSQASEELESVLTPTEGGSLANRKYIPYVSRRDEIERLLQAYPRNPTQILPTRLGNVLRRYERMAGAAYELDAVAIVPPLLLIAEPGTVRHVNDQRIQLDLTIRMCMISLIASLISFIVLWRNGPWVLIALAPYALAYLFYRGAVIVAGEFGVAFSMLIELNRFALYERLRMPAPSNLSEEREQNTNLLKLLLGDTLEDKRKWIYDYPTQDNRLGIYWWRKPRGSRDTGG
jgi:hypothetical protein